MHRTLAGITCATLLGSGQYLAGLAGSHNISSLSPPMRTADPPAWQRRGIAVFPAPFEVVVPVSDGAG